MKDRNEAGPSPAPKPEKVLLEMETSDSVWKDRAAATIDSLARIDDVSWAGVAKTTGNPGFLDLARLGPEGRKLKFDTVAAKARDDQ